MESSVQRYFSHGLAPSTRKSYESAQASYINFCNQLLKPSFPLSEDTICEFAAFLGDKGLKAQTIKCYMSALRYWQISNGFVDPVSNGLFPKLEYVIKGIKRIQAANNCLYKLPRLPITPNILSRIQQHWASKAANFDCVMLWAAFCLGFFGFLRSGEFTVPSDTAFEPNTHLTFEDIAVDSHTNPTLLSVHLKRSKTDPFRQGVDICIGRTSNDLCPLSAILAYMALRGPGPGPLFRFADRRPLTRARLVQELRQVLAEVGICTSQFSGHSFRIGAATTAAAKGLEDSTIKMLGRWESSAYTTYIKTPRESLAAFSHTLGEQ